MGTVLFDFDGTLCDITHRLPLIKQENPDWDQFFRHCVFDEPKENIIALARALGGAGHKIHIVSGRSNLVMNESCAWLNKHGVPYDAITMRHNGDHTPDDKLKRGWLRGGSLGPREDILFAIDDRQRVVDMWREEGLTCLQVEAWEE